MGAGDVGVNLKVLAAASVANAGGAVTFAWQSGDFDAAGIIDNGAGDISLTLLKGVDAAECVIVCNKRGAVAASQLCAFGVVHVSDTVKRITSLQEGAAGAVSALTDMDFDILICAKGTP